MNLIRKLLSLFITITFPFVLIMFSIRVLFTPLFLVVEYNMPGFPSDPYGFSKEERLKWGSLSIQYLFNNEDPEFLENLRFEDGTSIYNQREVSHMVDVKILLQQTLRLFYLLLIVYIVIVIWAKIKNHLHWVWAAASKGGWLTLGLIGAILAAVVISFDALFTAFHKVFFVGDTWLFYFTDTLIRLFPMRLWQDAFIFMGIITVAVALFFAIYGNKKKFKKI
ncbi:MAG: TIGR01906 family membrane protein [Chloroflexi bacterium HGW-Chloroflexi-2]|jgi:integral membrane protein (TIGR01906 family)|nr:MAG: TIGR01906 family membrane protein [Chloroflexi bacterium HGW-Chloroflexi-2]